MWYAFLIFYVFTTGETLILNSPFGQVNIESCIHLLQLEIELYDAIIVKEECIYIPVGTAA